MENINVKLIFLFSETLNDLESEFLWKSNWFNVEEEEISRGDILYYVGKRRSEIQALKSKVLNRGYRV